jgi:hypothetical protein
MIITLKAPTVLLEYGLKLIVSGRKLSVVECKLEDGHLKNILSLTTLDLNKIQRIRKAANVHFNVIYGILQVEALRRYFIESGKISDSSELTKWIWVPFLTGWPSHPAMTTGGMTNRW